MKTIQPQLVFNGTCAEAMNFYKDCLGGELFLLPYDQSPVPDHKGVKNRILHSTLNAGTWELRGSDAHPDQPIRQGDNFIVLLQCDDVEEVDRSFVALSRNGEVTMPLQKTFFSARFGMLVDRFGVHWKISSAN